MRGGVLNKQVEGSGMDIKIIVAAHKLYQMPQDDMYLPVHVGAAGKADIAGYARDDTGENISELNPFFCELTGLYWAWKNLGADYIGLVHYRRHFRRLTSAGGKDPYDDILIHEEIMPLLGQVRTFVPRKRRYYIETLYSHYAHSFCGEQLDIARQIISERHPEYLHSCDRTYRQRWGYMFNMTILERTLLNDYCQWLFDILFELYRQVDSSGMSSFERRFCGRVSEILFNVWLGYQVESGKIKQSEIKELPLVYLEKVDWVKKGGAFLRAKFMGEKYSKSM